MKPECEAAVRAAAGGNDVSDKALQGIEERLLQSSKTIARRDRAAWERMSPADRLGAAAKEARATQLEQMAATHAAQLDRVSKKAANDALIEAVPAGQRVAAMDTQHFMRNDKRGDASLEAYIASVKTKLATQFDEKTQNILNDPSMTLPIAKELMGEDSANPEAKQVAKKVADAIEATRLRRNRAGIPVNRLENYHMPQPWEWTRFAADDKDTWIEKHLNRLDLKEFMNPDGSQMSPEEIRRTLGESWLTLHTNGANKRAENVQRPTGGRVGSQYNAPRQLHFKDAESWMASMREYGPSTNMGSILREHFQRVGRDIAIAEKQGYLADRDVRERLQKALAADLEVAKGEKRKLWFGNKSPEAVKRGLEAKANAFLQKWQVQSRGHTLGNATWAARLGAVRSLLSSSKLGTLVSQQPSDALMTANYLHAVGLDQPHWASSFAKGVGSAEQKAQMRRMGVWSDNAHDTTSRFGDTEIYNNVSRFLNGGVYRLSGMRAADRGTTSAIADSVFGSLGRHTHKTADIESLPAKMKEWVHSNGFTQEHWNVMRMAALDRGPAGDRTTLTPDGIYNIPDEYLDGIARSRLQARRGQAEPTDGAVSDETARLKDEVTTKMLAAFHEVYHKAGRGFSGSAINEQERLGLLAHPAGTPMGEAVRMFWMIKQTPMGIMLTHLYDIPKGIDGYAGKARYIAGFALGQALATGMAAEAKRLISGENPEDIFSGQFAKEVASGAILGPLMANIIFGQQGESSTEIGDLMGPGADTLANAYNLYMRGRNEAGKELSGENSRFSGDKYASQWLSFVRSNAVPFMNMWYTKAAFNHLIYQQLQERVSPGYNDRVQQRLEKENSGTWWNPGEIAPQQAPNWKTAVGAGVR